MNVCVYGGQYGSEGKGCVSQFVATQWLNSKPILAIGENSPNSGHTCVMGTVRSIPAASFFANEILLGPGAVVNFDLLKEDLDKVRAVNSKVTCYIHEHAGVAIEGDRIDEEGASLVSRISSTGSGSGAARWMKFYHRLGNRVVKAWPVKMQEVGANLISRHAYMAFVKSRMKGNVIFECGHGTLLDTSWGVYPYVTSRSTLPVVALNSNGLGHEGLWEFAGAYRVHPVRTGGPSGPTGGKELTWEDLQVPKEITSVTKRVRRVFEWSDDDFALSISLQKPDWLFLTHCDYCDGGKPSKWIREKFDEDFMRGLDGFLFSEKPGEFEWHMGQTPRA